MQAFFSNHRRATMTSLVALLLLPSVLRGQSPRPTPRPINLVEVTTTDFAFAAPDTVVAGPVVFRLTNAGRDFHHVVVVPLPAGKGGADLVRDTTFLPTWAPMIGGPNVVHTGHSTEVEMDLAPGRYAMICLIPTATDRRQHKRMGMVREFVVVPAPSRSQRRPMIPATHTAVLSDYAFTFSKPLTRGRVVLEVVNEAVQPHEIEFIRLHDGVTMEQGFRWRRTDSLPAPYDVIGGVSPLSQGARATALLDLTPGRYVLVCYVPDATSGRPHVAHGMVQEFVIE